MIGEPLQSVTAASAHLMNTSEIRFSSVKTGQSVSQSVSQLGVYLAASSVDQARTQPDSQDYAAHPPFLTNNSACHYHTWGSGGGLGTCTEVW